MLDPGSEFRSEKDLEPLWGRHKYWDRMKAIITKGVAYPLLDISEEERIDDLEYMISRGNHKSARTPRENVEILKDNYRKEVESGWTLPIPVHCLRKIKGASIIPVGVQTQHTTDEIGKRKAKRRTTHDATFPPPSDKSVNNRMDKDELAECFYGHCSLRILHKIHRMRIKHPKLRILLIKIDQDSFGVANGPSDYGMISEPVFDMTNDILQDTTYNPKEVFSPIQPQLPKATENNREEKTFGTARKLFVKVPFHEAAADGYIDDAITAVVEKEN